MKNIFYLTGIVGIILIAFSFFYYLVVYLPEKNEYAKLQDQIKAQSIAECQQFIIQAQNEGGLQGAQTMQQMEFGIDYLFSSCMRSKGID